jgi:hypothetical protein
MQPALNAAAVRRTLRGALIDRLSEELIALIELDCYWESSHADGSG